jgi:hypothetical protein
MFKQIMETIKDRDDLLHRLVTCGDRLLKLAEQQHQTAQRLRTQLDLLEDGGEHPSEACGATDEEVVHNAILISRMIDLGRQIERTTAEASLVQRDLEHAEGETRRLLGEGQVTWSV